MPRVSVITPVYNHSATLGDCIRSVLAQTFEDWEMIIVDDGSSDDSLAVARSFPDLRIQVIAGEHKGIERLGETYGMGLARAQGDLVAILEGDDWWSATKLATQVPDFDDPEVVLSSGRFEIHSPNRQVTLGPPTLPPPDVLRNSPVGRATIALASHHSSAFAFAVTVVMRRASLEAAGGFLQPQGFPLVDFPTFFALSNRGEWRFHDEVVGCWRRHEGSVTKSRFPQILNSVYRHIADEMPAELPWKAGEKEKLQREWQDFQFDRAIMLAQLHDRAGNRAEKKQVLRQAQLLAASKKRKVAVALALAGVPLVRLFGLREPTPDDPIVTLDTPPESLVLRSF